MARHSRHRSLDDYPPYAEPYGAADPYDAYPTRQPDRGSERYHRRPEPSYHDDRWDSRDRDYGRESRYDPRLSRDTREPPRGSRDVRGTSEMRPNRTPYDHSPGPTTRSRRGQSEAPARPSTYASRHDRSDDPYTRPRDFDQRPEERSYGGHARSQDAGGLRDQDDRRYLGRARGYSQDREPAGRGLGPEHRYPPRSADTRRGGYHPGSGAAARYATRGPPDDEDPRFERPSRARTHPAHLQQPLSRGSPPPRGRRPREHSPEPYYPGPAAARSRSMGYPPARSPPRSRSVPAARPPPPDADPESKTKSRAAKAASYAAVGAAARVAFRAGAQAAYKLRDDPSPWMGQKGVRVATAALGAGLVDGIVGNKKSKMKRGGMRHQAMREAAEFGLQQFVVQPIAKPGKPAKESRRH